MFTGYGNRDNRLREAAVDEWRLNNIQLVQAGTLRPDPFFEPMPLDSFIGRNVKICFGKEEDTPEHMWVNIARVEGDELVGTLANSPAFVEGWEFGDEVRLTRDDIEMVETNCGCSRCPLMANSTPTSGVITSTFEASAAALQNGVVEC